MQTSLQQLFGSRAIQTSDYLIIDKRDLIDLSTATINTSQSLLVAIVLNAVRTFEGTIEAELGQPITDASDRAITFNNSALYEVINIFHWKRQFITFQNQPKILNTFVIESNEIQ